MTLETWPIFYSSAPFTVFVLDEYCSKSDAVTSHEINYQAEVRGFQHDGSLHLQARSQKYGKVDAIPTLDMLLLRSALPV